MSNEDVDAGWHGKVYSKGKDHTSKESKTSLDGQKNVNIYKEKVSYI